MLQVIPLSVTSVYNIQALCRLRLSGCWANIGYSSGLSILISFVHFPPPPQKKKISEFYCNLFQCLFDLDL